MFFHAAHFNRIKSSAFDPADRGSEVFFTHPLKRNRLHIGIVEDNKDPDKLGRLKVRFPFWGETIATGWIPFARPYAGKDRGLWALPEIDDQVVCVFLNDNPSKPVVIGCMYTPRAVPPVDGNKGNNVKVLTTKSGSSIVIDDTDGEEHICVMTKDGEMRLVLDKAKGLQVVNEKGDINITCRKLIIEAHDAALIGINKDLSVCCKDGDCSISSKQGMELSSGAEGVLKGSKIKLSGSGGVTAGFRQIAKQDDMVVGVDFHDIMVPSSSGLVTVPMIPHPYMGKLADKLSDDVTVNDKAAAVKGSKSKFDTPGHFPMPPGVKFKSRPNNEGEVSSGTEPSVKINKKEAAVLGSMVKTCNDPQPQETCAIVAIGAAVPVPIMIPGLDAIQFEKDGGFLINTRSPSAPPGTPRPQDIERSLADPKWSTSKAVTGEEVTLEVRCVNQHENAGVFFTVWEEGADREKDMPVAVIVGQNNDGKAEVTWKYTMDEFVFKEEANPLADYYRERLGMEVDPRMFRYHIEDYEEPFENPAMKTARFCFTCTSYRCETAESGLIEIGGDIRITILDEIGKPMKNVAYKICYPDGKKIEGTTGDDGKINKNTVIPGRYQIQLIYEEFETS
ncbi:MAG: hypothetical protein JW881_22010 [Spirochaetales bacterium]|nr:hypothetical protein [Spirochaetales bacterium]